MFDIYYCGLNCEQRITFQNFSTLSGAKKLIPFIFENSKKNWRDDSLDIDRFTVLEND